MRIIFLGPPAAGKGTQAQMLQSRTNIPLIVMGDILRAAIQRQDEIGKAVAKYVTSGDLVPDDLILKIIMDRFSKTDCQSQGFLLDGFPRTIAQAEALDHEMQVLKHRIDMVLYYQIPDSMSMERICGRRTCRKCDAVYHLQNKPSKTPNVCDVCGGELYQREDDKPEVMRTRLESYHKKTAPLIEYFQTKGLLTYIDASQDMEHVFQASLSALKLNHDNTKKSPRN